MARALAWLLVAMSLVLALAVPVGAQSDYTPTLLKPAAPLPGANGVALDAQDDLWVGSAGGTIALDPLTGERSLVASPGMPSGLATDGTDLCVADWIAGTVSQVMDDGAAIEPAVVASGLALPEGLAVLADDTLAGVATDEAGSIYLASAEGVVRYDP